MSQQKRGEEKKEKLFDHVKFLSFWTKYKVFCNVNFYFKMFFSADFFSNSSVLINYNVLPQKSIKKTLNSKYNYYNIIYKK